MPSFIEGCRQRAVDELEAEDQEDSIFDADEADSPAAPSSGMGRRFGLSTVADKLGLRGLMGTVTGAKGGTPDPPKRTLSPKLSPPGRGSGNNLELDMLLENFDATHERCWQISTGVNTELMLLEVAVPHQLRAADTVTWCLQSAAALTRRCPAGCAQRAGPSAPREPHRHRRELRTRPPRAVRACRRGAARCGAPRALSARRAASPTHAGAARSALSLRLAACAPRPRSDHAHPTPAVEPSAVRAAISARRPPRGAARTDVLSPHRVSDVSEARGQAREERGAAAALKDFKARLEEVRRPHQRPRARPCAAPCRAPAPARTSRVERMHRSGRAAC